MRQPGVVRCVDLYKNILLGNSNQWLNIILCTYARFYENGLKFNNTKWSEKMGKDTEWYSIEELLK